MPCSTDSPLRFLLNTSITTPLSTDFVNCTANGYPLPTVRWVALNPGLTNPQSDNDGPGWAFLSFATTKVAAWNCTAYNGLGPRINQTYTFTPSGEPPSFRYGTVYCFMESGSRDHQNQDSTPTTYHLYVTTF